MASLDGRTVRVAGAGVLGLSIAIELAQAGAAVTVHDPSPGTSASIVAAGMLAPVFEAVLDPVAKGHFPLLMAARDLWPAFAARTGIVLDRAGATYAGERALEVRKAVAGLGVAGEARPEGLFVAEDWRLDAEPALEQLRAVAKGLGVTFVQGALDEVDGEAVAATGWQPVRWAPESAVISAIKGQIGKSAVGPLAERETGLVQRRDGGYIAPAAGGALVGATMERGRTDLTPDDTLLAVIERAFPELMVQGYMAKALVGIRGATPDGLPLVGQSVRPGVWLAMGARRNGWLLAPLVAAMTRAYLAGEDPGPWAAALDARRFTAQGQETSED
ncbi:MAG: FAD-dependent oxidoreductase [Caulobacteraceae bacterium]|nr:MAG: FAD-dependent oxidoreductase [Caulobacteraceae bacterium]